MSAASGGDVGDRPPDTHQQNPARTLNKHNILDRGTWTPAWTEDGVSGGTKSRTFTQIIQNEQTQRKILEIQRQGS